MSVQTAGTAAVGSERGSDESDAYLRDFPLALAALGRGAQLAKRVTSLQFLCMKLSRFGLDPIHDDADNCVRLSSKYDVEGYQALADALRLAGPALVKDPSQLPSQIAGRLVTAGYTSIACLVEEARNAARNGLLALTPALIQGHKPITEAVDLGSDLKVMAITADGKFAITAESSGNVSVLSLPLRGNSRIHKFRVPEYTAMCLSADGRFIFTGDGQGRVAMWDRLTGFCEASCETGGEYVIDLSLAGTGHLVLKQAR